MSNILKYTVGVILMFLGVGMLVLAFAVRTQASEVIYDQQSSTEPFYFQISLTEGQQLALTVTTNVYGTGTTACPEGNGGDVGYTRLDVYDGVSTTTVSQIGQNVNQANNTGCGFTHVYGYTATSDITLSNVIYHGLAGTATPVDSYLAIILDEAGGGGGGTSTTTIEIDTEHEKIFYLWVIFMATLWGVIAFFRRKK